MTSTDNMVSLASELLKCLLPDSESEAAETAGLDLVFGKDGALVDATPIAEGKFMDIMGLAGLKIAKCTYSE